MDVTTTTGPQPVQRLQDAPQLLDGGHATARIGITRGLRPVQDARQAVRVRARPPTSTAPSATRPTRLSGRPHVQPEHRNDGLAAFSGHTSCASLASCGYNNSFYVTAGHDESSTWQEFGGCCGPTGKTFRPSSGLPRHSGPVLNSTGNPIPNWRPRATSRGRPGGRRPTTGRTPAAAPPRRPRAPSRACSPTSSATCESCLDNYNNPFADNQRNYTEYWEMMSRETFNGPSGTHNRWQIPNASAQLSSRTTCSTTRTSSASSRPTAVTVQRDDLAGQVPRRARGLARIRARELRHREHHVN